MSDDRPREPEIVDRPDQSETPEKVAKTISPSPHEIGSGATGGVVVVDNCLECGKELAADANVASGFRCSFCGAEKPVRLGDGLGFDDPRASPSFRAGGRRRSFPHSYGGEGFNHVD